MSKKTTTIHEAGKPPITFKRGALHEQLEVEQNKPIPPAKKAAALAGDYGPLAKRRADFAFRGALAAGRQTAKKNK